MKPEGHEVDMVLLKYPADSFVEFVSGILLLLFCSEFPSENSFQDDVRNRVFLGDLNRWRVGIVCDQQTELNIFKDIEPGVVCNGPEVRATARCEDRQAIHAIHISGELAVDVLAPRDFMCSIRF